MFKIIYNLSDDSIPSSKTEINNEDLRYYFFLGQVTLTTEKSSIFLNWNWIPVLDFAICLLKIYESLVKMDLGKEEFEFTESDEKIIFKKKMEKMIISTTFSDDNLELDFKIFGESVKVFFKAIVVDISNKDLGAKNIETLSDFLKSTVVR